MRTMSHRDAAWEVFLPGRPAHHRPRISTKPACLQYAPFTCTFTISRGMSSRGIGWMCKSEGRGTSEDGPSACSDANSLMYCDALRRPPIHAIWGATHPVNPTDMPATALAVYTEVLLHARDPDGQRASRRLFGYSLRKCFIALSTSPASKPVAHLSERTLHAILHSLLPYSAPTPAPCQRRTSEAPSRE